MKNILLKITSVVVIICMIATIFIPFSVKSSQTTLTNMYDTGRGVGNTSIWKTTIKGYSNSYCVRGGAHLYTGAQLNDKGSIYTNSFTDITSNQSAIRWILDNIYLDEGVDNTAKSYMIHNLKQIVSEYAAKKDSNGKSWLAKAVGINSIDDNWVNNAVNAVISDKDTLYAVQQYAIWNFVNNADSNHINTLQNSDGSYNKLPGAKIDKQYYIGYYVVLREMAKLAQKNNYVSPNSNGKFVISLENNSAKATLQNDKKSVLMGPYTLKNNHNQTVKTLTATVNSENVNSIQAVNEKGQAVDIKTYTGKLYFKVTYNKGFAKGVSYKIKVNVKVTGYKTFANILYPSGSSKQPIVSIRKEAYNANPSAELSYREEITGKYSLEILKTGNDNKALSGVKFKVKQTGQTEKEYGPSNNNGIVSVIQNKEIKKAEQVSYIITEIKTSDNTYALLADPFQINITLGIQNEEYKPTKVAFTNGTNKKEMKLKNGTVVTLLASISGNTVRVTVPNRKITGSYSLELIKKDENGKAVSGVTFGVQDGANQAKSYGPTGSTGIVNVASKTITAVGTDEYTITEVKANNNYITLKDALKLYVTKEIKNYKFEATKVSFEKSKVVTSKQVSLKDGSKVTVSAKLSNGKVSVKKKKKKIDGNYSLEILKVDEKNSPLSGVNFKVQTNSNNAKTYGPTSSNGIVKIATNQKITQTGIDEYTINEVSSKNNQYITIKDDLKIYVTKEINNYKYVAGKVSFEKNNVVTTKDVLLNNGNKVTVLASINNGKITITIPNKKIEGSYGLQIRKIELGSSKALAGASFKVKEGNQDSKQYGPTNTDGNIVIAKNKQITSVGTDEYTISEVKIDKDYITLKDSFKIYVTKEIQNYQYVAGKVSFEKGKELKEKQVTLKDGSKVTVTATVRDGEIIITVPNKKITGNYSLELEKINSENIAEKLQGVTFKVQDGSNTAKTYGPTGEDGKVTVINSKNITQTGIDEYTISEVNFNNPKDYYQVIDNIERNGFIKLKDSFKIYITKAIKDNNYQVTNVSFEKDKELKTKKVELEDGTKVILKATISGNTVKVTIPNKPDTRNLQFDMALRKYITRVIRNGKDINIGESRKPIINEFSATEYEETKTAGYYHTKTPVTVKPGDTVVYTLKVYNEGEIAGFAKEITDYLPQGLEYVENSNINKEYNWKAVVNSDGTTTVKTDKLKDTLISPANGAEGFRDYAKLQNGKNPKFCKDVQIVCKVKSNIQDKKLLVNVAEITNYGYNNDNGEYIQANKKNCDIDSIENNVFNKDSNITNIDEYYEKIVVPQIKDSNKAYKGLEDDDDFENVYVEPDEIEIKFVLNKVDQDGNPLIGADFTVERMKDNDTKVLLNNEEVKGTYEVIEKDVRYNKTYSYKVIEVESAPEYVNVMEGKYITIRTYMGENKKLVLGNYEKVEAEENLINKYGFIINNEDGSIVKETETDLYQKIKLQVKNDVKPAQIVVTIPNELKPRNFDLALRKFITAVTKQVGTDDQKQTDIINRIPTFRIDENGKYVYEHTKDPVIVANGNIVTYTLRVYNEGNVDGYAKLVKDDIPEGLEFLPDESLNKVFRWVMLDKDGKETKDAQKAAFVVTDYLSKEQEKEAGANLINAFDVEAYNDGGIKEPNYKEVKVSFKVNKKDKFDEIVINQAQISKHSDKDGNENIKDIDSTPDKWIDGEDDQDIEKIKVQYFDLSLRKWVTKAITVENGVQTVTETGHKAEDDPEQIVKVDLKDSKIKDVTVKFEYSIRVKNEGQIAGYAKEISDYIPQGLKFVKEDNPDWKEQDGKVVTEKLKDTLLKPGETAEVTIILTWINDSKNMGLKVNTAEISKDYNEDGSPDIDSVPDNKVPGEDDIDDAPIMLTVKTGQEVTYFALAGVVFVMLACGTVLIKKFVLK